MKRAFGIIIVIIAGLNIFSWFFDFAKGTAESPMYYIFIFILLGIGIWMISSAKNKKKDEQVD